MVDSLSRRLEWERERYNLPTIRFTPGINSINHGKFVDDTMLIGGASTLISMRFKPTLGKFLKASGGTTYDSKIYIFTWNTTAQKAKNIEYISGSKLVRD